MTKISTQQIIQDVQNGEDAGFRREAIITLGYKQDPDIFPVLLDQLKDPSSSIQHAAVISLGRYGNPEAIDKLIKPRILRSAHVNIRWAAVAAIGRIGDDKVIEHLVKAADDDAWIVRNQAVTEIKAQIRTITTLREQRSARLLLRLLAMKDREIIELAIEGLVELGQVSIDLLLSGLKYSSSRIREHSATTLGILEIWDATPLLIVCLSDKIWYVRRSAVHALGQIRNPAAIEPLVRCLGDHVDSVQHEAITALVGFRKESTVPLLNTLIHEPNKFVIRAILLCLGEIKDPASIPALIQHLRSSYFVIRNTASRALVQFGSEVIKIVAPVMTRNTSNIKALIKTAENPEDRVSCIRAIRALGVLEDHRAVPVLKKLVESHDLELADEAETALAQVGQAAWGRCSCLNVLRELDDPAVLPYFIISLEDTSANVRLQAVRGLERFGGKMVIEALINAARSDQDAYVRTEAVRTLRKVGVGHPEVLDLAISCLADRDRNVRMQSTRLLGNFQDMKSIAPLIKAMTDTHWGVREAAEIALYNFGAKAGDPLIEALSNRSWMLRKRAARLLGNSGEKKAGVALEKALKKRGERKEVREQLFEALAKIKE
ncbi:HEAT repeat domain-containing protein [candidate division KSB1 bacterium]|nr:HEAT repeat domain-containing protein [candidate division KSB1 bacterium]